MIKLDDTISGCILENTNVFQDVHPNCITVFGIALNLVILYYLFFDNKEENLCILGFVLFLRWLADCLDGNIARKYKKTSKIGNILDTTSDIMLEIIIALYLSTQIKNKMISLVIIVLCAIDIYQNIYQNNIFDNHDKIKKEGDLIENTKSFLINNSYILFIAAFFAIKYV
jgi:hypothetical protein